LVLVSIASGSTHPSPPPFGPSLFTSSPPGLPRKLVKPIPSGPVSVP